MTPEVLSLLNRAIAADLIPSQTVHFNNKDHLDISEYGDRLVSSRANVEVLISMPTHSYRSWDELLKKERNRIVMPSHFLIIEDDCTIYSPNSDYELIKSYAAVTSLINFLKSAADHESYESSFVYLGSSKLTIDIIYNKESLESVNVLGFELFTETMLDNEHARQKKYILQDVLFNMLLQVNKPDRFDSLLSRLQDFVIQFEHGYRLFVTSFSFNSVRREYEDKYREYNTKLNSSISDVATKALATPITMLFAVSNITPASTAIGNYAVVVSSMLVSIFIAFLVKSNADSLNVIKVEYTDLFARLSSELMSGNVMNANGRSDIDTLKDNLDARSAVSHNINKLTLMSAVASSIFVILYLIWVSCFQ
ncbi:MAG: hypothetical protein ACRDBT_05780 [Aeromonas sp.]